MNRETYSETANQSIGAARQSPEKTRAGTGCKVNSGTQNRKPKAMQGPNMD